MNPSQNCFNWFANACLVFALTLGLAGCSIDDGEPGVAGPPGPGVAVLADATSLNFIITGASIGSAPVVNFTVTNQDGVAVAGFSETDLRFNIAKLVPGSNGYPGKWQNYINRASDNGAVQGTQERSRTGYSWGTLVDYHNGTFTYTFATDITNPASNPCPAPCTDADGNVLDISYQAGLTHRVTIQQGNSDLPKANAIHDFVPAGGTVTSTRDIVQTATCNECHNQLSAHGNRIETKLCVTCHNPGSWDNTPGNIQTVDFKVMIHKIHRGKDLPSVNHPVNPTPYIIGATTGTSVHDFSTVVFPYSAVVLGDTRACAKCHDGAVTAQGDNWKNQPSKAACSSCHDDVYFGISPNPTKPYETVSHIDASGSTAPPNPTDDTCINCHGAGKVADLVVKHDLPNLLKAEGAKYQFNILKVVNSGPGRSPRIRFSITNPANGVKYDLKNDTRLSTGSISLLVGWNNTDENNAGSTSNPGQPLTIGLTGSSAANAVDNGNKTYTVDLATATLGSGVTNRVIPPGMTGSGRAAIYGRVAVDVDGDTVVDRVRVKAAYMDYAIDDPEPVARRQVVDIAKCDKCHDQVSLHGDSRTNEPGLCVICHNPNATDINRRPKTGGIPVAATMLDNKKEEAIDFKRLIHGIHAAAKTLFPVAPATVGEPGHGFRNKGLVVYGYFTAPATENPVDFSHVRFPGILNDCTTCHLPGTYELTGNWEVPTVSGILGSTIDTAPGAVDAATLATGLATNVDDLNTTPTAAVCSSCHDGDVAKSHMILNGALFAATQATIDTGITLEACAICHGPGRIADVKVIHGVK